jgi:hypothetical protein
MQRSSIAPDDFIASLPDDVRDEITALDADLARIFIGLERALWEGPMWGGTHQRIIGYGAVRQANRSGASVDWFVIGLAVQKAHLSLYVSAVDDGQYLVKRYADRLGKVKVGSANVTFRRLSDVELPVLVEMAERARDLMSEG